MNKDARYHSNKYYQRQGSSLEADFKAISKNPRGVIIWTRALVVIMKPDYLADKSRWHDLAYSPRDADAWYIHLLTGNIALARALIPMLDALPWFCFQRGLRNNKIHRFSWERIIQQKS